jgi:hypothetical protein
MRNYSQFDAGSLTASKESRVDVIRCFQNLTVSHPHYFSCTSVVKGDAGKPIRL